MYIGVEAAAFVFFFFNSIVFLTVLCSRSYMSMRHGMVYKLGRVSQAFQWGKALNGFYSPERGKGWGKRSDPCCLPVLAHDMLCAMYLGGRASIPAGGEVPLPPEIHVNQASFGTPR